jgi:hypothetical protein
MKIPKRITKLDTPTLLDMQNRLNPYTTERKLVDAELKRRSEKARTFKFEVTVPEQRVKDLVCCGFEGGVDYWCQIQDYENPNNVEVDFNHIDLPFVGGAVLCKVTDEEDPPMLRLDAEAIEKGLKLFSTDPKNSYHFANWINENDDAETGDVFLQLCMLGEVVYG